MRTGPKTHKQNLQTTYKLADIIFNLASEMPTEKQNNKIKEFAEQLMRLTKTYKV